MGTFTKTFQEKTFVGKLSNLTMSCRRSVEKGHYKSEDQYIEIEGFKHGIEKTLEFTVYKDAAGSLKVTFEVKIYTNDNGIVFYHPTMSSHNPPEEMTYTFEVKQLGYFGDETKRPHYLESNKKITSDDFVKKNGEMFHQLKLPGKVCKWDKTPINPLRVNLEVSYVRNDAVKINGASLITAMQNLYLDQATSDLTILCDSESLPCHKFILATRSDVFKTMFDAKSDFTELQDGVLKIEDIDAHTMKVFLEYMYTDSIKTEDINCKVLMAAHKYNFERLFSECSEHLKFSISKENVVEIIRAAYLLDADDLFRKAVLAMKKMDREEIKEDLDVLYKECPGIGQKIANYFLFDAN